MGLFIGASILTILELFDYIYEVRFGVPSWENDHMQVTSSCPNAQNRSTSSPPKPAPSSCPWLSVTKP